LTTTNTNSGLKTAATTQRQKAQRRPHQNNNNNKRNNNARCCKRVADRKSVREITQTDDCPSSGSDNNTLYLNGISNISRSLLYS